MSLSSSELRSLATEIANQVGLKLMADLSPGRWMKVSEAAAYSRVSRDTIYRWIKEGYIHANKRTGEWIIDRESIDDWYSQLD